MPRRRPMTMVEWLIVMSILGILASIILPNFQQASQRAQRRTAASAPAEPTQPDGQLNVIEPPETSESAGRTEPGGRALGPVLPIAVAVLAAFIFLRHMRRHKSRHA